MALIKAIFGIQKRFSPEDNTSYIQISKTERYLNPTFVSSSVPREAVQEEVDRVKVYRVQDDRRIFTDVLMQLGHGFNCYTVEGDEDITIRPNVDLIYDYVSTDETPFVLLTLNIRSRLLTVCPGERRIDLSYGYDGYEIVTDGEKDEIMGGDLEEFLVIEPRIFSLGE